MVSSILICGYIVYSVIVLIISSDLVLVLNSSGLGFVSEGEGSSPFLFFGKKSNFFRGKMICHCFEEKSF